MRCRYCGLETEFISSVSGSESGLYAVNHCPACGLTGLYPVMGQTLIHKAFMIRRDRFPAFDSNFDWKLFFARRYLGDGDRVLVIGTESHDLASVMAKELVNCRQITAFTPDDLRGFATGEFEAIFIWDALEFVHDLRGFLKEIKRMLKEDGYLAIRVRDKDSSENLDRGVMSFMTGQINFIGKDFLRRIHQDVFHDTPHCFMQEAYDDSTLVTLCRVNPSQMKEQKMSVLIVVHHFLFSRIDDATGPRGRVLNTIDMLDRQGVKADISLSLTPNAQGYDIVHLFHNAWETQDALSQMVSAKGGNARVIISTIYMDPSETNFVINSINRVFKIVSRDEREAFLNALAEKQLTAGDLHQCMKFYAKWNIEEDQRALLEMADRIICFSFTEMRQISLNLDRTPPFSIVYNSANEETFGAHGPEAFLDSFGVSDFIIAAGHVEWRKNQLMLLYAMREHPEIPIVIVGAKTDDEYYQLCKLWSHRQTIFIPQLKHRHLASAFAAARVHAQPSWIEGISLSTIEAAMCGCSPVVSDRAGEIEYFGDLGYYANPGSVDSIRRAVVSAYRNHSPMRARAISDHVKSRYTFGKAVEMTIDAYRRTLSQEVIL